MESWIPKFENKRDSWCPADYNRQFKYSKYFDIPENEISLDVIIKSVKKLVSVSEPIEENDIEYSSSESEDKGYVVYLP